MCIFIIGGKISLEFEDYDVREETGTVSVCAVVRGGSLSSNVQVTIRTLPSTATCKHTL